jgi:hypothetical protein
MTTPHTRFPAWKRDFFSLWEKTGTYNITGNNVLERTSRAHTISTVEPNNQEFKKTCSQ